MNIKLIRYADEGFKNYKQLVKIDGKEKEIEGCYVFIKKVCKKALKYDIKKYLEDNSVVERKNHLKNELFLPDNTFVYARMFNVEDIWIVKSDKEISIQGETFWKNWDDSFTKVTLKELYDNILEYEGIVKELKKEAKINDKYFSLYNMEHKVYEAILDVNSI